MLPTELPASLYSILGIKCEELSQWQLVAGYLGALKIQITQYNDVIETLSTSTTICENGVGQYIRQFNNQLSEMITKFTESITLPLKALELVADGDVVDALEIISSILDDIEIIFEKIAIRQKVDGFQSKLDGAFACFLLLQPYVLKGARINKFNN